MRDQNGNAAILGVLTEVLLGDKHAPQIRPVIGQLFGVGHPGAIVQGLKAARFQGIELGQGILLVEQQLKLRSALRRQAQAQPGNDQRHDGGRHHTDGQQALLAHAGGRQDRHLALEVHAPVSQKKAQKQAQRQDQLQEARQTNAHDQEQRTGVHGARGSLGQVFNEATAHDDDQQHSADSAQCKQDFAGQITEDDQTRHSRGRQAKAAKQAA